MKSEREEFKHTRNVLMNPFDLAKTENLFLFHITTNKSHLSNIIFVVVLSCSDKLEFWKRKISSQINFLSKRLKTHFKL